MNRVRRSLTIGIVAVLTAIGLMATAPPSAAAAWSAVYEGKTIRPAELELLQRQDRATHVVIDGESSTRGIVHAFDSEADAADWEATLVERLRASATSAASAPAGTTMTSSLAACPALDFGARLYEHTDCGGSHLWLDRSDSLGNLANYGFNDKASSVLLQKNTPTCILILTVFTDAGFGGAVKRFFGQDNAAKWNLTNFQLNDKVSAAKTQCS